MNRYVPVLPNLFFHNVHVSSRETSFWASDMAKASTIIQMVVGTRARGWTTVLKEPVHHITQIKTSTKARWMSETSSRFIVSTVLFVISIWNFTLHFSMQWQDGRITGEGTLTYADGDRFFAFFNLLMFAT